MKHTETIAITEKTNLGIGLISVAFLIPFLFGHAQIPTGIAVNALLFATSLFLPKRYWLAVAVAPSLAVISRGVLFGPLTPFIMYFAPCIWVSNMILMHLYSRLSFFVGAWGALIGASLIKFIVLFGVAQIFFSAHIVPKIFLTSMGGIQLLTALCGGVVAHVCFHDIFHKHGNGHGSDPSGHGRNG